MEEVGKWQYSTIHDWACKVIETQTLWGDTTCRVWLPDSDSLIRVSASSLRPIEDTFTYSPTGIAYVVAAARVADAFSHDVLMAPIESSVIPLPHQIQALSRAISNNRIRYLLADEVGLGKTIEAGLIMRELKIRGLAKRVLVVAPKGLVTQWISEMRFHFNEEFQLIFPEDLKTLKRISPFVRTQSAPYSFIDTDQFDSSNPWQLFRQVIVPIDSFKPLAKRRGKTKEDLEEYNRERFENLIAAGWDLIIVDEAHRLGGSTDQVARHKLGRGLAEASPYLLLLTATPHQGKTDAFHRLISLLDSQAFPDVESISKNRIKPYVIRTEKRQAINAQGTPLFTPRKTQLVPISWKAYHSRDGFAADRYQRQRILYDAVTEYVRYGYNQSKREKKTYIGFLMILMQRLVTSSTSAIRTTLERRLEALRMPGEQLSLFPDYSDEEWMDLDGQEQIESFLGVRLKALKNERAEVELLLEVSKRTEEAGTDVKADALLDWIYRLQQEEGDSKLKILIFTEFVPTQAMLRVFLTQRGFSAVCLNGSMSMEERMSVQDAFAKDSRILISTDAGGEGLNLQFCHVVVNYDIPWNPMRLEQRIGRVDRIGQKHKVYAINFVLEDTVEYRVREVLEEKLSVILEDFGVDKTGDVLDSAQAGQIFDDLYIGSLLDPKSIETNVEKYLTQIRQEAQASRENVSVLGEMEDLNPGEAHKLMTHPLPHWVERMCVSYLEANGGKAERSGNVWNLTWPDGGEDLHNVVFTGQDADLSPSARRLTLEDHRIRGLAMRLPRFAPGQPIPCIEFPDLPSDVYGLWSLWQISLHSSDWKHQRVIPLFIHDDGRTLGPTARFIWEQLLSVNLTVKGRIEGSDANLSFERVRKALDVEGRPVYDALLQIHDKSISNEREKGEYAFSTRRQGIKRIGLKTVRDFRISQLEQEELEWRKKLEEQSKAIPDMVPLIIIRVGSEKKNG